MTIGSILLQPQPLERFGQFSHAQSFGDDGLALAQRIASNPEWLEPLVSQVGERMEDFIADLQAHIEARMNASQAAMQALLDPLIGGIEDLIGDDVDLQTVGDVIELLLEIADKIAGFVENLSLDRIRAFVEELLDILFETFGFDPEFLQDLFCRFIDIVIEAMETVVAGASNEYIELQLQIAAFARRLKREILEDIPALEIDSESIARLLMDLLRELGLDKIQQQAQCLAGKLRALVDAGTGIYELARAVEGGGSIGALKTIPPIDTGKQYCWYASWLYHKRRRTLAWEYFGTYFLPMVPRDEVWISEDGRHLILRHATEAAHPDAGHGDDEVLYSSPDDSEINWYDAPQFSATSGRDEHFTFTSALSPEFMEQWARATSIVVIMFRMGGHVVHASEPGNHVTHSILSAWHLSRFIGEAVTGQPFTSFIRDKWGISTGHRWLVDVLFGWMPVFGGSFEGFNTNSNDGFQHWMTLIGDDVYDTYLTYLWPTLAYEGFLSIFTLINQRGAGYTDFEDTGKPKNFEYSYPLTNVWLVFFSWLQSRVAMNRLDYSHPFEATHLRPFLENWLGYSWMFGALAGISGELCGWALSRQVSPRRLLIQIGWGAYKGFFFYVFPSHYFWNEGDTDGGRYNPTNAFTLGANFPGYGNPATSPYRLPIAGGRPIFVGQSHQGMFSHFVDGTGAIQTYASDFAHGFQEMITAIRDGVVVDYFDWIPDDIQPTFAQQQAAVATAQASGVLVTNGTNSQTGFNGPGGPNGPTAGNFGGWNFIVIQHSNPNGTETAAQLAHDVDVGGAAVTTYAVYGHGANGGVRAAFATRGVAAGAIIGTTVNRGDAIMQAGDTGVSFHNHLHLHLRPGPLPGSTGAAPEIISQTVNAAAGVAATNGLTGNRTLPIVFGDATHPLKPNGILRYLTWYRSGNV